MRTKPVLITIGLIALAAAVAWWSREPAVEPPATAPAVDADAVVAEPVLEPIEVPENVLDAPPITASPQGLYDDLENAFERASKKPEIEYRPAEPQPLSPPRRADADDGDDEP